MHAPHRSFTRATLCLAKSTPTHYMLGWTFLCEKHAMYHDDGGITFSPKLKQYFGNSGRLRPLSLESGISVLSAYIVSYLLIVG